MNDAKPVLQSLMGGPRLAPSKRAARMLASGMSEAQILDEYDFLESDDIKAALAFAASQVDHAVVVAAE